MRVTVQNDLNVPRRFPGRDVHETESNAISLEINDERPAVVGVAVAAHDCQRRPYLAQRVQETRGANISEMPNFADARRELFRMRR